VLRKSKNNLCLACLAIVLFISSYACSTNSTDNLSPEQQIQHFVDTAKIRAESRDIKGLNRLIAENYTDNKQRNKQMLSQILTGYFWRYKNIHIFTQINNLRFSHTGTAQFQLLVAMADLPIDSIDMLLKSRARLYQFDMEIVQEKSVWKLHKTNWQIATLDDFLNI